MDHGTSFAALPLPLVHLSEQVQERLLGVGNVAIGRPAEELELTHHQLALLKLHTQRKKNNKTNKRKQSAPATFAFLSEFSQVYVVTTFSPAAMPVPPVFRLILRDLRACTERSLRVHNPRSVVSNLILKEQQRAVSHANWAGKGTNDARRNYHRRGGIPFSLHPGLHVLTMHFLPLLLPVCLCHTKET